MTEIDKIREAKQDLINVLHDLRSERIKQLDKEAWEIIAASPAEQEVVRKIHQINQLDYDYKRGTLEKRLYELDSRMVQIMRSVSMEPTDEKDNAVVIWLQD